MDNELERIKMEKLKKLLSMQQQGGVNKMSEGNLFKATSDSFEEIVLKSELPVIVDFWAEWCMPCRMIAPIFEKLSKEYAGKMKFVKLNVDENPDIAAMYGIQGIPTLMIFYKGQPVNRIVGALPEPMLRKAIDETLSQIK